jgi:transposase
MSERLFNEYSLAQWNYARATDTAEVAERFTVARDTADALLSRIRELEADAARLRTEMFTDRQIEQALDLALRRYVGKSRQADECRECFWESLAIQPESKTEGAKP